MLTRRRKFHIHDLNLFKEFLASEDERREIQQSPAIELQEFAIKFMLLLFVYIIKRKLHGGLKI